MPDSDPPIFFHEEDVASGHIVRLTVDEAEHAGKILRLKTGDPLLLADGRGGRNIAHVVSTRARHVEARIDATSIEPKPPGPEIWLGASIIRGPRFDLVVEKATELGVSGIVPVISRYTEVRPGESGGTKQERWRRLAIAAMKQSQRWYLPEIASPTTLEEVLETGRFESVWVADPAPVTGPPDAPVGKTLLLVGPEGGWSERERQMFETVGARTISLGGNRLRAETAAITMVVLARSAAGEMGAAAIG